MNGALDNVSSIVLLGAAAACAAIALATVLPRGRGRLQWSLALGLVAFAMESLTAYALIATTDTAADRLLWLRAHQTAALLVPLPWGMFAATLCSPTTLSWSLPWRIGLGAGAVAAAGMAVAIGALPAFEISEIPGPFYAARLASVGRSSVIVQLLWTVSLLAAFEACLRTSKGAERWRVKYLLLGLAGIFLVRFFFLSQLLLFHVLLAVYLVTIAATLAIGALLVAMSLARDRLIAVELTVSRGIVYRSVVIGTLGLYLFVIGVMGWLLSHLGIPEEIFWSSLVVFISALGLAAVLFSENVRWRIKQSIARNFYRSKYDYRQQWSSFTTRLGSLLTIDELAPQLLVAVADAVGSARAVLYLLDDRDGVYRVSAAVEAGPGLPSLAATAPLVAALAAEQRSAVLRGVGLSDADGELDRLFPAGSAGVPLVWRGALVGIMLIGPERTGAEYEIEDLEYLNTVGEQAAGVLVTARLSETVAQSREFEAFHRLTSFVIHDLKNSITSLSLLSQNALQHGDDPEFQRDSVRTLSRTVSRMKTLLTRLSSAPEAAALRFEAVALSDLVREATQPLAGNSRVRLHLDLQSTPTVAGDPEALLRVFQNLVGNAVEAIEGDGTVTVTAGVDGGDALVAVADTGCGMSEEFVRRSLFAPFKSTKKGGWGIGLYQAKSIVEAHRGTIEVTSREGEGTVFRVRLPLAPGPDGGATT